MLICDWRFCWVLLTPGQETSLRVGRTWNDRQSRTKAIHLKSPLRERDDEAQPEPTRSGPSFSGEAKDIVGCPLRSQKTCRRADECPRRVRYIPAKTKKPRDASQVRRPALEKSFERLIGQSVQPARSRVRADLLIPDLGIEFHEPGAQFLKLMRGQRFDFYFEFFHATHKHLTRILP